MHQIRYFIVRRFQPESAPERSVYSNTCTMKTPIRRTSNSVF